VADEPFGSWDAWPLLREAVERWIARRALPAEQFYALADELRARSFTAIRISSGLVFKDMQDLALEAIRKGFEDVLAGGKTVRQWREDIWDDMARKYGARGADAAWYMDTVFRTNVQAGYAAGRYADMFSPDAMAETPYVMYSAINDDRTRPEHRALDGKVFKKNDPTARRYFPPLGFNCRCSLIALSQEDVEAGGYRVTAGNEVAQIPRTGPDGQPLKTKDGEPVLLGRPPEGWDTDRVEALVPGALRNVPGRPGVDELRAGLAAARALADGADPEIDAKATALSNAKFEALQEYKSAKTKKGRDAAIQKAKRAEAELDELDNRRAADAEQRHGKAIRATVRNVIGVAPDRRVKFSPDVESSIRLLPEADQKAAREALHFVSSITDGRGKVLDFGFVPTTSGRAGYAAGFQAIYVPQGASARTIAHEIAHALEHQFQLDGSLKKILRERASRATAIIPFPEALERSGKLIEAALARAKRDMSFNVPVGVFPTPYMGRDYGEQPATEILSVAMELLFDTPEVLLEDKELAELILRLLGGR